MAALSTVVQQERVLKGLANRRRLAIVSLLKKRKEMRVGDIAESIGLSFKATSKHLSVLTKADVVEWEQRGLNYFYRLTSEPSRFLRSILSNQI